MRAQRSLYLLILLSALSLGFSVLHNNGALSPAEDIVLRVSRPVQRAVANTSEGVAAALQDLGRFRLLRGENDFLRQSVQELQAEVARLRETERENQALREAVKYVQEHPELQLSAARVVGRDTSNLIETILIDRGR